MDYILPSTALGRALSHFLFFSCSPTFSRLPSVTYLSLLILFSFFLFCTVLKAPGHGVNKSFAL